LIVGAIAGVIGIAHVIKMLDGDDDVEQHPAAVYSSTGNEVTRADMERCYLIENGKPYEEDVGSLERPLSPFLISYAEDRLLGCADLLDTLAFETARARHKDGAALAAGGESAVSARYKGRFGMPARLAGISKH